MNEAEQSIARKKRTPLALRLVIYALVVGIAAAFFFGMNSIEQWDVSSGRSRTVNTVIGVPFWYGEARPTTVSEWLGEPNGEKEWIHVRGPKIRNAKVSYCVADLLNHLHMLEGELAGALESTEGRDSQLFKRQITVALLNELRTTKNICQVSWHFSEFRMQFIEAFWHDQVTLTSAKLEQTWNRSGSAVKDSHNKPREPARPQ